MDESNKDEKMQPSHAEDLTSDYANNTFFEPTIWDLKILFGEWFERTKVTEWHTSITVPWAQAKLMAYHPDLNIAAHELKNGAIEIPTQLIPPEAPVPSKDTDPDIFKLIQEHRKRFLQGFKQKP